MPNHMYLREYRPGTYNCLHFTVEVWRELWGLDISEMLAPLKMRGDRLNLEGRIGRDSFKKMPGPTEPCLCFFRSTATDSLHIGTYVNRRVLHLNDRGVQLVPLDIAMINFKGVTFYEYVDHNQQ